MLSMVDTCVWHLCICSASLLEWLHWSPHLTLPASPSHWMVSFSNPLHAKHMVALLHLRRVLFRQLLTAPFHLAFHETWLWAWRLPCALDVLLRCRLQLLQSDGELRRLNTVV